MNSELLREREAFKKRAMAAASVQPSKRAKESSSGQGSDSNKKKPGDQSAKAKLDLAQIKSMGQGGSQFKFGVLAKVKKS